MKSAIHTSAVLALLTLLNLSAFGQGTAFTYQGSLNDGGVPANGSYDLRFALFDAASAGAAQGNALTNLATAVSNGLFTVTLDFGNQFPGADRWLEIAVRTNGAASFFTLSPRQVLAPAPYAITAGNVISGGLASGTYGNAVILSNASNQITGNLSGSGSNVTSLNASQLTTGVVPDERLSSNVALLDRQNAFSGDINSFGGSVGIGTSTPRGVLDVVGLNLSGAAILLTAGTGYLGGGDGGNVVISAGDGGNGLFGVGGNGGNLILQPGVGGPSFVNGLGSPGYVQVTGDLHVSGSISGHGKVTSFPEMTGPLSLTNTFTSSGGTLIITVAGSGSTFAAPVNIGMLVQLDGGTLGNCHIWANSSSVHIPFVSKKFVAHPAAGPHTIRLSALPSTNTDINDNFNVTIEEQYY